MPELPEVEAVCRVARRALDGWRICLPQTPRQVAAALDRDAGIYGAAAVILNA